jgi:hypothetical protein
VQRFAAVPHIHATARRFRKTVSAIDARASFSTGLDGTAQSELAFSCAGSRKAESFADAKDPLNLIQVMLAKGDTFRGFSRRHCRSNYCL